VILEGNFCTNTYENKLILNLDSDGRFRQNCNGKPLHSKEQFLGNVKAGANNYTIKPVSVSNISTKIYPSLNIQQTKSFFIFSYYYEFEILTTVNAQGTFSNIFHR